MNIYESIIAALNNFLYQSCIVSLFLIFAGLFFTVKSGFLQFSRFGEMFRIVKEKSQQERDISSFAALMVSISSLMGTGNVISVSASFCSGGPGAIFGLWVTALLGGTSVFVESTLALIHKRQRAEGKVPRCHLCHG